MLQIEVRNPTACLLFAQAEFAGPDINGGWKLIDMNLPLVEDRVKPISGLDLAIMVSDHANTHRIFFLEDNVLVIKSDNTVISLDTFTGTVYTGSWTPDQVTAIIMLAVTSEDGMDSASVTECYRIAEEALAGWPKECRPIP